ncbi:APA2 [Candida theae]|uniref:Complex III subunit 7 n=1 Tax=Candida theae TaxID=1198502 RepID=A0AAD5FZG1_9ASCO|nr:APA2 [Candida theae]KAI5961278.1 APA2 [Candida theae]
MSLYELPATFYTSLSEKYQEALKTGAVLYNGDAAVNEIESFAIGDKSANVQLTMLTSLMHRPEKGDRESNPFEKPEPELTILEGYGPNLEFKLVFNKFPVISKHFLMVTREFKHQNTPLSEEELSATYKILTELAKQSPLDEDWFAFYNCGPESGASQPHKHIQFMRAPSRKGFKSYAELLSQNTTSPANAQNPSQDQNIPFAHYLIRLNENDIGDESLAVSFASLLQHTMNVLKENDQHHISFNFVMTTKYMLMVPRSNSKFEDKLGINACGVYGLILCKNQELFDMVKEIGALNVLKSAANFILSRPTLSKIVTPLANKFTAYAGYREMGLKFNDLLMEETPVMQKAIKRLPPSLSYSRNFRILTAHQLSLTQQILPPGKALKPEEDDHYLIPYILEAEKEAFEKAELDNIEVKSS